MDNNTFKNYRINSNRLQYFDYSQPGSYFITICTANRCYLFGNVIQGKMMLNDIGKIVLKEWLRTQQLRNYVNLDVVQIMPNHLHGIVTIQQRCNPCRDVLQYVSTSTLIPKPSFQSPSHSLGAIIRGFKSSTTKQIKIMKNNPNLKLWQANYHEHIIRNDEELDRIRRYIVRNPLKWEIDRFYRIGK